MSQSVCQFLFFRVKPSVRPEDPGSDEGLALLNVFRSAKLESGHRSSAWGRAAEDEHTIVWVIDWTDPRSSTDQRQLEPFLATDNPQAPTSLHVTLTPPISTTSTLTKNPVTELVALPFVSTLSTLDLRQLNADLINFRTALVEQLPQSMGPQSWAMGQLDRPSKLVHANSPSGQALVHFLAVGWESVQAHMKVTETDKFKERFAPLREKMLAPIPGLEMKHVSFHEI